MIINNVVSHCCRTTERFQLKMNYLLVLCLITIGGRIQAQESPIGEELKDFAVALSGRFKQAQDNMVVTIKPVSMAILPKQQNLAYTFEYTLKGNMEHGQIWVFHNMSKKIEIEVYSINPDWLSKKQDINSFAYKIEKGDVKSEKCTTEYNFIEGAYRLGDSTCDSPTELTKLISLDCTHLQFGTGNIVYELDKIDDYWVPDRFTPSINKCKKKCFCP